MPEAAERLARATVLFLGLVFVFLKLFAWVIPSPVADWSWWLVLLPIYGPPVLVVFLAGILLVLEVAAGEMKTK